MEQLLPPFEIGARIRLLRQFCGLTQIDLARKLEVSQGWLSKAEAGILELSARQLMALRIVFGISTDAFLDGVIPYYEISKRFSLGGELLPEKYKINPTTTLRAAYPFVATYRSFLADRKCGSIFKALELKLHLFADPSIPVNSRFLWDLLAEGSSEGLFSDKAVFRFLSEQAFGLLEADEATSLKEVSATSRKFFERWMSIAKSFGAGHEFLIDSIVVSSAQLEFWSKAPTCQKNPQLAEVFTEYYRQFLTRVLTERDQQRWAVQVSESSPVQDQSPGKAHVVRYRVSWN